MLKLAPAFTANSCLLVELTKLGGGAGRRRTSNYRAEVGISGRGIALKGRPTWTEGSLDRNGCPQILSLVAPSLALSPPTMAPGKLAAPAGAVGLNITDRISLTEVCGGLEPMSLADPTPDGHADE